jgi:hypothetical protein
VTEKEVDSFITFYNDEFVQQILEQVGYKMSLPAGPDGRSGRGEKGGGGEEVEEGGGKEEGGGRE